MKVKRLLVVRADGSREMGLGHLYRSRSLAAMMGEAFTCVLFTRVVPDGMRELLEKTYVATIEIGERKAGDEIAFMAAAIEVHFKRSADQVTFLLDGYHFGTDYQLKVKQAGYRLVCIDDVHEGYFHCDLLINHSGSARRSDYEAAGYTEFLLGLRYALLGEVFLGVARSRVRSGVEERALSTFISFGGSDQFNLSQTATTLALEAGIPVIHVVAGPANQYLPELQALAAANPGRIQLHAGLSAREMCAVMQRCDKAITSPSSVALEYLSTGGTLYLKPYVDNQQEFYADCVERKLALPMEEFPDGETDQKLLQTIFDGRQAERLREAILNLKNNPLP